ncbi:unnamed protein product [Arabis nemorensis]|uniref:Uncharacterized protein n=1 Tax=Arabis nemorensis TaxID=586526 RepID=A0A565BQ64_9BRAS|nr:unnamed protein product [Arabis nemorensis]
MIDLQEDSQRTNATSNEPKQEKEPINETLSGRVDFPLVNAMTASDRDGSCSAIHFLWPSSVHLNYRCIYRVPCRLRRVNPEAYTPQMLLIGPLQYHSKKAQAFELSKNDLRYLDYNKMEQHKKKYLNNFTLKYGNQTVDEFIRIIKRDEQVIRACYAETTELSSHEFVGMMLLDSVFILVYLSQVGPRYIENTGDFVFDEPCHQKTIFEDLILLENQLPYALLENLFEPFFIKLQLNFTFRDITLRAFGLEENIKKEVKFLHFTDLVRHVRVETLGLTKEEQINQKLMKKNIIKSLHNADELDSAGVQFKGIEKERDTSLVIKFEGGILTMPCLIAEDATERILRNIMALEQCHYSYTAFVCDYITFLDFLINTEQDVDFLVEKGVIENWLGRPKTVAEMVNKLCLGIVDFGSHYFNIAENLNKHYNSRRNRSVATLRRVYFKDLWTGTATVTAVVLVLLTLIGTVASVLQMTQK